MASKLSGSCIDRLSLFFFFFFLTGLSLYSIRLLVCWWIALFSLLLNFFFLYFSISFLKKKKSDERNKNKKKRARKRKQSTTGITLSNNSRKNFRVFFNKTNLKCQFKMGFILYLLRIVENIWRKLIELLDIFNILLEILKDYG